MMKKYSVPSCYIYLIRYIDIPSPHAFMTAEPG